MIKNVYETIHLSVFVSKHVSGCVFSCACVCVCVSLCMWSMFVRGCVCVDCLDMAYVLKKT